MKAQLLTFSEHIQNTEMVKLRPVITTSLNVLILQNQRLLLHLDTFWHIQNRNTIPGDDGVVSPNKWLSLCQEPFCKWLPKQLILLARIRRPVNVSHEGKKNNLSSWTLDSFSLTLETSKQYHAFPTFYLMKTLEIAHI